MPRGRDCRRVSSRKLHRDPQHHVLPCKLPALNRANGPAPVRPRLCGTARCRYWISNETDVSYWLGGLITGGIAPQFTEDAGLVTRWDSVISRWLRAHSRWGHLSVGGVRTLRYDAKCCHTEGECEWQCCNDTIISTLSGGTQGGAVTGVYVSGGADSQATVVPAAATPTNSTVLVFAAWQRGHQTVRLTVGNSSTAQLQIVATSPAPGVSLELSGGILTGPWRADDSRLRVSTFDGSGQLVRCQLLNHTDTMRPLPVESQLWFRTELEWIPVDNIKV